MIKFRIIAVALTFVLLFGNCKVTNLKWEHLFDGSDLEQWDTYLGPKYSENCPKKDMKTKPALGLNNDTAKVFSIVEMDGENVIRVSGEIWGALISKKEYDNYHLKLQFKWGDLKWFPRNKENDKRDSGLLYHSVGTYGENNLFWLTSQEYQIQHTDVGDYWGVPDAFCEIKAKLNADNIYQADANGQWLKFKKDSEYGRHCKKSMDYELPLGEWNTVDLYCFDGASKHYLNGELVMETRNSAYEENGEIFPLKKGKIQIQSEAAEVYYKDIKIKPIKKLPD